MKKRWILIIIVVIAAILLLCPLPRRVNMAYSDVPVLDNNGDITEYMPTLTVEGYGQIGRLNDYSSMGLARDNGDENHILDMFFSPGWSEVEVSLKIVG